MTTESPPAPATPEHRPAPRAPRPPRRWPFGQDATGVIAAIAVVVALLFRVALVSRQADIYHEAGAASFEAAGGALMAQLLVIFALVGAGAAYRWGVPIRWVYVAGGIAAALALAFALLPHLAAGHDWLTTLLGFLVAMMFDILLAAEVALATAYLPLRWARSGPDLARKPSGARGT